METTIIRAYEIHERKVPDDHKMFLYQVRIAVDEKYSKNIEHSFQNQQIFSCRDGEFKVKDDLWDMAKPNLDTVDIIACGNHIR